MRGHFRRRPRWVLSVGKRREGGGKERENRVGEAWRKLGRKSFAEKGHVNPTILVWLTFLFFRVWGTDQQYSGMYSVS